MKKIRKRSLHGILQEILNIYFVILTCLIYLYTDIVIFFDGYINLKWTVRWIENLLYFLYIQTKCNKKVTEKTLNNNVLLCFGRQRSRVSSISFETLMCHIRVKISKQKIQNIMQYNVLVVSLIFTNLPNQAVHKISTCGFVQIILKRF